jgi:hypothetical protein
MLDTLPPIPDAEYPAFYPLVSKLVVCAEEGETDRTAPTPDLSWTMRGKNSGRPEIARDSMLQLPEND